MDVGPSAKWEIILSKLHTPSSDVGSPPLAGSVSANSSCVSGPEGGPRQRFGAEHQPACALPSTQSNKKTETLNNIGHFDSVKMRKQSKHLQADYAADR